MVHVCDIASRANALNTTQRERRIPIWSIEKQADVEMDPPIFIMESMNNGSKQPRSRTRTIENELTLKEKERE